MSKVLDRIPAFLKPYTNGLRNAPVSHVTTFLLLHELTALLPLIGLSLYFHYTDSLPHFADNKYVSQGIERFSRYFRRKGWFGLNQDDVIFVEDVLESEKEGTTRNMSKGTKIVLEVATAYAITKVLMPVRLVVSVWATPACARLGLRALGALGLRSSVAAGTAAVAVGVPRGAKGTASGAAGTGAVAGGVIAASKAA